MAIGGVVINFVAKTADAVSDTKKLSNTLDNLKTSGKNAAGSRGLGGLFKTLAVGVPVVGAVVAGVVEGAEALWDMGKAAYEDAQQARKLEQTLKKIPGVTDDMVESNAAWIDSMEVATLIADTDLRVAMSKLALATGDVDEAQKLVALSADVATGANKNFTTVATAMAAAAAGNTAQLERMFPWLDKNKDGTVSLKEATDGLADSFGGAAEAAAANDPFKRLKVVWDQLKEAIGEALVPLIDKFSGWMNNPNNRARIQHLIDTVSDLASALGEDLADAFQTALDWLQSPDFKRALIKFRAAVHVTTVEVQTFVRWLQNVVHWIGAVINAIDKLVGFGPSGGMFVERVPTGTAAGPAGVGTQAATRTTTTAVPAPPTVIVTEEQVYRAVQRLLLRGDARNGRLVMVR